MLLNEGDTTTVDGPIPLSQVWIGGRIIARDVHGDDLVDVLQQNGDASAWAVVPREDTGELRRLARILDLDDLSLTELLLPGRRVGFVELAETRLLRLRLPAIDRRLGDAGPEDEPVDISMIIADQVLIMLVDDHYGREVARMLSGAGRRLSQGGADRAAQLAIEFTITRLAAITADLEDAGDGLAEELFGGQPLSRERKLEAFRLRRAVTNLRRLTDPTREVIIELVESLDDLEAPEARRWSMIIDHADRVAGNVDLLGESLTAIFDTSLSLDNARMDEVMKKLTGWAAIIAVPTLITGFVGMNVSFWGYGSAVGFYVYLALIVVVAVLLYVIFRRKSWI